MTAQTIAASGVNILNSSNSSNVSNSKNTSLDNDFSKCLSSNLKSSNQEDLTEKKVNDTKITNDSNTSGTTKKNQVMNSTKETKEVLSSKDDVGKIDVSNVDDKKPVDNLSNEITALSDKIESIVKETLDLSEDELKNLMSTLGLTMLDLLNPDNLKNLVLAASGETNITAVLTNEDLSNQLTNLYQKMNQLDIEDFGITKEELKYLLDNNTNNVNKVNNANTAATMEEAISGTTKKEDTNDLTDDLNIVKENGPAQTKETDQTEKDIVFTVHKEVSRNGGKGGQETLGSQEQQSNSTNMKVSVEQDIQSENDAADGNQGQKNQDGTMESKTDQLINNLTFTTIKNVDGVNQEVFEVTQMRDIVNQIVKEIRINIKPDSTGMELQLNPENLGKVNLLVTAKEGVLTAQFTVQNSVTKEAIESQIQVLKENLNNQGVKVESIEVTVSNFTFSESNETFNQNQEQKNSKRALKLDGFEESNDLSADGDILSDMLMNGSTVSYTA